MDVLIVGSIVVDLISYCDEFPKVSQTILGNDFEQGFGGKGANQAFSAGILGARSGIVGKVGNDMFGQMYLEKLRKHGIDISNIQICESARTGVASIIVRNKDGANEIIIVPGANYNVSTEDIIQSIDIIKSSKIILCQLEIPLESTLECIKQANKYNVPILFNPAPYTNKDGNLIDILVQNKLKLFIFCPNETETNALINEADFTVKDVESAKSALTRMIAKLSNTTQHPMITLGHLGVVYAAEQSIFHEPAPTIKPVDSTGAGDCFAGSLAYFIACHPKLSIHQQIQRAIQLASYSVQFKGTQSSFPDKSILLQHNWL